MKKRMYISIPITGQEEASRVKAAQLQKHFESQGYEVVNPHEIGHHLEELNRLCGFPKPEHRDYMVWDLQAVHSCTDIYFCKGWEHSEGCKLEHIRAQFNGIKHHYE